MRLRIGLLTLGLALATGLVGCSKEGPAPAPPLTFGTPRVYHFQLDGERADHPFNDKVFFRVTTRDVWRDWEAGAIGEDGRFAVEGGSNERYEVRTEENPSEVEREVFWMLEASGRLPELDPKVWDAPGGGTGVRRSASSFSSHPTVPRRRFAVSPPRARSVNHCVRSNELHSSHWRS